MSASANPDLPHRAYLCLGSNIDAELNMRKALRLLRKQASVLAISRCWETEADSGNARPGTVYPNFLNMAIGIATLLEPAELKTRLIAPIENALGRVRTADKYAPRTIDLDLIVYDEQVVEPDLWKRPFIALTLADLLPDLINPSTGETLQETAARLRVGYAASPRRAFRP